MGLGQEETILASEESVWIAVTGKMGQERLSEARHDSASAVLNRISVAPHPIFSTGVEWDKSINRGVHPEKTDGMAGRWIGSITTTFTIFGWSPARGV